MPDDTFADPTGLQTPADAQPTQHPRAPRGPLEHSERDAVALHFARRNREPDYDAIAGMVKPYRYVNATFRVYPLLLGEPDGPAKVRMLADGSEAHLGIETQQRPCGRDSGLHWFGPAFVARGRVGADGSRPDAWARWCEGCLPIAQWRWQQAGAIYSLDAFAACIPGTAARLALWLRVAMERVEDRAEAQWHWSLAGERVTAHDGYLVHPNNRLRGGYSSHWAFDDATATLGWRLAPDVQRAEACLVLLDQPAEASLMEPPASINAAWAIDAEACLSDSGRYLADLAEPEAWATMAETTRNGWRAWLDAGASADLPERRIVDAGRAVRASARLIANRDQMNYSVHNPYERMYTDEGGQAIIGLSCWGHARDAARYLGQLSFYNQANVGPPHELGARLHWFCRHICLTDDHALLALHGRRMRRWAQRIADLRAAGEHGLAPRTAYCGDIHTPVNSFNGNAMAWLGLRDYALLTGDDRLLQAAADYRDAIVRAVDASIDRDVDPPFVPMALLGDERSPAGQLTDSTLGSYWCLIAPYALYSNVLGDDHEATQAMLDTFDRRGGLCAGLVRLTLHADYNPMTALHELGIDDLYGCKLADVWARRDEPDRLVLALYGKLALGLTPDTCIAGEGGSLVPSRIFGDDSADGRSFYLPPNSASQMFLAILLRHCLVFDYDRAGDGRVDALRLAFSTPRRWLAEGERIAVRTLPTAFGEVAYELRSAIDSAAAVTATVDLPSRDRPAATHLRLRVPPNASQPRRMVAAHGEAGRPLPFDADEQTIDLTACTGRIGLTVSFA